MKPIIFGLLVAACCGAATAPSSDACDRCGQCGCEAQCQKVCRLVCETKKVTKTTYDCKCEDFCVPGRSDHCVTCDECGKKKHVYTPTCAHVETRKVLVKKETTTEVPSYKWVVETVCGPCACKCNAETAALQKSLPAQQAAGTVAAVSYQAPMAPQPLAASSADAKDAPQGLKADLARVFAPIFGRK